MNILDNIESFYLIGIKGVAMTNLAIILTRMGKKIDGCDVAEEFITDELLQKHAISWMNAAHPIHLPADTDCIVYSAAHDQIKKKLIAEAKRRKIAVISQAELIGELMKRFTIKIAVSGCHGKTTTASLLSYALNNLKTNPSYLVGTPFFGEYPGGAYQNNHYFIVEADEYGVNPPYDKTPKFHLLNPDHIICTNIDFDHPDVYADIEETKQAFLSFFDRKNLFLCADDQYTRQLLDKLDKKQYTTFGFSQQSDLSIRNDHASEKGSVFDLYFQYKHLGQFSLSLFGKKNISNATAVIAILLKLGYTTNQIKKSIQNFRGAKRRFEVIFQENEIVLFDDYAHHPSEIEATLLAARSRFSNRRIIVLFQPHTFSRTKALLHDFTKALSLADRSIILPIFASARENPDDFSITSDDIASPQKNSHMLAVKTKQEALKDLKQELIKGDVIFTMGAGDVYKLKDDIIYLMKRV